MAVGAQEANFLQPGIGRVTPYVIHMQDQWKSAPVVTESAENAFVLDASLDQGAAQ